MDHVNYVLVEREEKKNMKEEMVEKSYKVPQHKLTAEHRSKKSKDGIDRRSDCGRSEHRSSCDGNRSGHRRS